MSRFDLLHQLLFFVSFFLLFFIRVDIDTQGFRNKGIENKRVVICIDECERACIVH